MDPDLELKFCPNVWKLPFDSISIVTETFAYQDFFNLQNEYFQPIPIKIPEKRNYSKILFNLSAFDKRL